MARFGSPNHFLSIEAAMNAKDAEIDRLRTALETIAGLPPVMDNDGKVYDAEQKIARDALEQNVVSTPESPVRGSNTNGNQGQPGGMPGTTICKHGVNTAISICPSCAVREYQLRS